MNSTKKVKNISKGIDLTKESIRQVGNVIEELRATNDRYVSLLNMLEDNLIKLADNLQYLLYELTNEK